MYKSIVVPLMKTHRHHNQPVFYEQPLQGPLENLAPIASKLVILHRQPQQCCSRTLFSLFSAVRQSPMPSLLFGLPATSRSAIIASGEERNGTLINRALPSGCVQAHCGGVKGTTGDSWKTFYEITVEHNGRLIFHLIASSSTKREWHGIRDPNGNQWGLEMKGDCVSLNYLNTIQPEYGWIGLSRPDTRSRTEKNGGWCVENKSGPKCVDAKYWESTFRDYGQCGQWANPPLCNNYVRGGFCGVRVGIDRIVWKAVGIYV
ncbi:hypothetical protein VTL71DRAFT_16419 [Oculimacula yallundae]|uniref:Uncharacterized protein n=1 Tax=Oculimacula yallundae TaxID=86028 RepID=A0ABR4CED0_9HELO